MYTNPSSCLHYQKGNILLCQHLVMSLKTLKTFFLSTSLNQAKHRVFFPVNSNNYRVMNSAEANQSCDLGPLWLQCVAVSDRVVHISSVSNQLHSSCLQISLQELQGLRVQTGAQHRGNLLHKQTQGGDICLSVLQAFWNAIYVLTHFLSKNAYLSNFQVSLVLYVHLI
ncbi:hypothetical protein CHARACLAT_033338 [Characodon lateralis]|uniref:Uncharacterized protein n=1 Tax=Characodon lateralis TaxID=208331 RepID=A0ABU7D5L2_9TELE|nr:hypothetical protein [Characodon lateralis]